MMINMASKLISCFSILIKLCNKKNFLKIAVVKILGSSIPNKFKKFYD